jgi:hypothetical protein
VPPIARLRGRSYHALATLALAVLVSAGACVPPRPTASPDPSPAVDAPATRGAPAGWIEHEITASGVLLALPEGWLVLKEADLSDPDRRARLESEFEGASALFGQLDAQGRRARLVFLGVDARARGTGRFAPNVTVIAVEPAVPSLLLGIGADLTIDALERAFTIETEVVQDDVETPVGDGIRISFTHRVGGAQARRGIEVEHDGALVTTGRATFLLSRNVEPASAPADTPALADILATLRPNP